MIKFLEKWLNYSFQTSSGRTQEFDGFSKEFKRALKKLLDKKYTIEKYISGHFYVSGFIKNEQGQFVYFSCSDVRYFKNDWAKKMLVRSAKNTTDFTGGPNKYTEILNINNLIESIFNENSKLS